LEAPKPISLFVVVLALAALLVAAPADAGSPKLRFHVFARTGVSVDGIVWDGTRFVYVQNTLNRLFSVPPAGLPLTLFATLPKRVEETRCVLSPGTHGFPSGVLFCHDPNHRIYEVDAAGHAALFAVLPGPSTPSSDGALAFDPVGRFGYALIAGTGRSGNAKPAGGSVFAIDSAGHVRTIGAYQEPGGADELMIAPAGFGTVGGDVLLTVDAGSTSGTIVAMSPDGKSRVLVSLPGGPNPIVALPRVLGGTGGSAQAGLYVTDDETDDVYLAPAAELSALAGKVVVGAENSGAFWILEPAGSGFRVVKVPVNFKGKHSLEAAIYVG
jgi:hypothetical protein